MLQYQGKEVDRAALEALPKPSKTWTFIKWLVPALVLAAFFWGYQKHAGEGLRQMLYAWIIPNAVAAALFAAIAGARPLTVIVSLLGSPITSLNPTIGVGMFAGLCEAWLRKPTVQDCEHIPEAMLTVKGMYKNRFTRVLLVAVAASLGSALGAWIGGALILSRL